MWSIAIISRAQSILHFVRTKSSQLAGYRYNCSRKKKRGELSMRSRCFCLRQWVYARSRQASRVMHRTTRAARASAMPFTIKAPSGRGSLVHSSRRGSASAAPHPEAKAEARAKFLPPIYQHLNEAGLGHISEICDAEPPHTPRGCPFQEWSVGELLRLERSVLA